MLKLDSLHVHYGLSHVIQGVQIEARPGEVVGIFGRNGVGKTTLLKTIAGWVTPSGGAIQLGDQRLDGLPPDQVCHHGVGFVPEDRRIFPGLSVEENLRLGLMQRAGRSRAEQNAEIERIYQRMPSSPSGGGRSAPRCRGASSRCWRWPASWWADRNWC